MKTAFPAAVLLVVFGLSIPASAFAAFDVPGGFIDEDVVDDVGSPTAIAFFPDGDLVITSQEGRVFRYQEGDSAASEILDITDTVCEGNETGLLGVAVDPDFGSGSDFVYLYYTDRKGDGSCGQASNRHNRVSRFELNGGSLGNEQVLIDKIPAPGGNHNGGDLQFDDNGLLYVSVGDGGKDLKTGNTQDGNGNARRLSLLNGKILRIERDGSIPASNPYSGKGTERCAERGKAKKALTRKAKKCREIFATGLRNPFRIAFDPDDNSGPQRFFINDVGGGGFEEVNSGQARADYGWNKREGPCPINDISNNCSPSNTFEEPVFAYRRDGNPPFNGCTVITAGAFVPNDAGWPGELQDACLFTDLGCGRIFELRNEEPGDDLEVFADGEEASHFVFGPDGALYYAAIFDGEVRRIVPV